MKCIQCGNTDVAYKGERKDGSLYHCPLCKTGTTFDNGKAESAYRKAQKR